MPRKFEDFNKFFKADTKVLGVLKDRMRSVIGNTHWGEEGRYKEMVLQRVIASRIGATVELVNGFVVKKDQKTNSVISTHQIDILMLEAHSTPWLRERDLVVAYTGSVKGVIEVKTNLKNVFDKKNSEQKKIADNLKVLRLCGNIFHGYFIYDFLCKNEAHTFSRRSRIAHLLLSTKGKVNYCALGNDYLIVFYDRSVSNPVKGCYRVYKAKNAAPSYFIAQLIKTLRPNLDVPKKNLLYPKRTENLKIIAEWKL